MIEADLTEASPKPPSANPPEWVPGSGYIHMMRICIACIACVLTAYFYSLSTLTVRAAEACDPNGSQADLTECYGNAYKASDAELNALYKQIEGRLKDDEATTKLLVTAQRAWLAFRDAECDFSTSAASGGTIVRCSMRSASTG